MQELHYELEDGWVCHTPDPNRYHDLNSLSVSTMGGRPLGSALSSRFGINGIVLPRATVAGGSRNKAAHKTNKVVIASTRQGEPSFSLDISKLSEEAIEEAVTEAAEDATDMREMAFRAFYKLAETTNKASKVEEEESDAVAEAPRKYTVPHSGSGLEVPPLRRKASFSKSATKQEDLEFLQQTASETERLITNPSSKFKGAAAMARNNKQTSAPPPRPVQSVTAPGKRVTFEIDGWGMLETSYHEVVRGADDISLVLIYDNNFVGGTKYFPPVSDQDIFVDVHEFDTILKVKSSGIQYTVGNFDHCLLLIEDEKPKEEE